MIRPERLRLARDGETAAVLPAIVDDVLYFGDHLRLRCSVGPVPATVKLPLGPCPPRGSAVSLAVPPEHLRVYR
jgi:putative spermidine/putrescine transport system ATP-binding protein